MISLRRIAALALIAFALTACGGGATETRQTETTPHAETTPVAETPTSDETAAPPAAATAPPRIRVIHATSDAAAADVSVGLDSDDPFITSLTYAHGSGYVAVDEGRHSIAVHGASTDSGSPVLGLASDVLEPEHAYTLFFVTQGAADAPFAVYTGDDDDRPGEDVAALRFFHAIIGVDDVDVCLPGATARAAGEALFADVAPNSLGTAQGIHYADLPAGEAVAIQVRAHSSPPCGGRVTGIGRFTPDAGTSYTAVAIGRTTGHPHAALQLLVCSDAPADGACNTFPMPAR